MDKFCEDCIHNEICRYDAICITGHCNDKETLDDLRPKGEWIKYSDDELDVRAICSNCKSVETPLFRHNFCPNCGAYMRKGGAEE